MNMFKSAALAGAKLGKKKGKYLLIFFKLHGTDSVALSKLFWRVQ